MTVNNGDSNQSCFDHSDRSSLQDIMIAKHHPTVSRREFLGMTAAASLVLAGRLNGAAEKDSKNGIHIEHWDEPVKKSL